MFVSCLPDQIRGKESIQPLSTRHHVVFDGSAQNKLSREHEAEHAEAFPIVQARISTIYSRHNQTNQDATGSGQLIAGTSLISGKCLMELAKGSLFAGRFTVLAVAKSGGTAHVYKAFDDDTQTVVALKVFSSAGMDREVLSEIWNRECVALQKLKGVEGVVNFVDAGRDPNSSNRFLVIEWIDGCALEDHLERCGKLSWESFYESLGARILAALARAAEQNILHRDLSTGNVLVTISGNPKIIDFGQARVSQNVVGRTVAGWRTAPYCPPEDDTGSYTHTRDPFAFAAIAVRACCGHQLRDHEMLYEAFEKCELPPRIRAILGRALSREPSERFGSTVEFQIAIDKPTVEVSGVDEAELTIPVRLVPTLADRVLMTDETLEGVQYMPLDVLLLELNDTASVAPASANENGTRIEVETHSYRMILDIDSRYQDHLVIVGLTPKRFRLDALYQSDRWIPRVRFVSQLPQRESQRAASQRNIQALYRGVEEFQASRAKGGKPAEHSMVSEWSRLLDALRHIARHEVPSLRYSKLESDGAWLTATVENPDDAEEEQIRTIAVEGGRWVFRGEIDSVNGNQCLLVSTRPRIDLETIPAKGYLDIDWQQTKVALDRQARAVERFKTGDLPNPRLGRLLTGDDVGSAEPQFAAVPSFFDASLDGAKKEVVSRCLTGVELLVTHGPPGTGKTKLIVELVRQTLAAAPDSKILLVSQTHAALDNALERLLKFDPDASCVRIGSGSKGIDRRVERCTVEHRGKLLRSQVEVGAQQFIERRAVSLGVRKSDVELGLRAFDVLAIHDHILTQNKRKSEYELELEKLKANERGGSTTERSNHILRIQVVENALADIDAKSQLAESELSVARERLAALGADGRELARGGIEDLREWARLLVAGPEHRALGELMKLAEDWRLRFGESDDFKAAIIASSSIVAGTCVGFCREDAASKTTFDLCIVDEAGKATTTELLVPLAQSRRAVIVGDHHQLPAVIDDAIWDSNLMDRFGISRDQIETQLFERLIGSLASSNRGMLSVQYRMRGPIGALISECFYDGDLKTDQQTLDRASVDLSLAGIRSAVTWLDPYYGTATSKFEQEVGTSYVSAREVACVVALLKRIAFVFENLHLPEPWPSIAVITGYAPQADLLRTEIRRNAGLDRLRVESATVHSFQGREVDICIYSVARRNTDYRIGMLSDWRHLNVALSRARDYLIIVGSEEFCRDVPEPNPFRRLTRFVRSAPGCDVRSWEDD